MRLPAKPRSAMNIRIGIPIFIDEERVMTECLKFLNIRRVIVEVQPGETEEEAWNRHLTSRPEDRWANIRIFNRQPLRAANT